ncbi:methyl-accepting chemotaxis protein [Gilvimarinus sp. DA14]|uniref:methyl-accepting chemotaxis protein n=1 Tax=Gilvimarinus sp. DA14 TaxID=2956798 RepID=UPI0020B6A68C|nr:methyl-accepting chemotaxis protein [Gilvimarinus sp. DA14]UTF59862.1 methyl-accepting chemotaxis protein [Gilvimarinus sp. DA14]
MTLRSKTWVLSSLILVGFLVIVSVGLWTLRQATSLDNEARVKQLLASTYSTVTEMEKLAASGVLSDSQAKDIATALLRNNIYHESEYVYVADQNLDFVAAPLDPELHGTSFHEFKDAENNSVGHIMLAAIDRANGELAQYPWTQRQADGSVEEKLSIAQRTPRWGWVVGTGIGFNEVNQRFWDSASDQLLICLAIMLLIVIPVHLAVSGIQKGLGGELKEVLQLVRKVAGGDLTENDPAHQAPEDSIYASVLKMRHALREMMAAMTAAAQTLDGISDNMVEKAQASSSMAEAQSEATAKIASSAEEFNQQTQQAMSEAEKARQQTHAASQTSESGRQAIASAVTRFTEIDHTVAATQQSIDVLADKINSISAVVSVISAVAEQTNLLALNAAIEAARAGEQGRGFAVVADEVRQLASRTTQATEEIASSINAVQSSSRDSKAQMDTMVKELRQGIEQTKQGGTTVESIREETKIVEDIVSHIRQAMAEHVEASGLILQYVSQVEDLSVTAKETAQGALISSRQIRDAAHSLNHQLEQFQI